MEAIQSEKFGKVERYYRRGLWSAVMVHNAVVKSWITAEECALILGA